MHIYFSGIGGTGLSALAHLALDCGYTVSGSDNEYSKNTKDLEARGAKITIGQSEGEIMTCHQNNPIDWLIATSALAPEHPHKVFANTFNVKISKRHELINSIIKHKKLKMIAVAGTHGKTTTVGMIVWTLKKLGIPVSYLIGTNISYGRSGEYDPKSDYFVYECDEFDRNFLNFQPYLSVIPSLDYDHPDTYKTEKEYCEAFLQFMTQSEIVMSWESVNKYLIKIYEDNNLSFKYMLGTQKNYLSEDENNQKYYTTKNWINLEGELMRRNGILALFALSIYCGFGLDSMLQAISTFPGTERRFEILKENLYTDYGHHPVEIKATLQKAFEINNQRIKSPQKTLQDYIDGNGKIVLVYQPHQNIRQHDSDIQKGYQNCFENADIVYWLPTYLSREYSDLKILTPKDILLATGLNDDPKFIISELGESLKYKITKHLESGDLVIMMGAGDIDNWARQNFI